MTDTNPEWVQTDLDFIAGLRAQADDYVAQADASDSSSTIERLAKEAAVCFEYADLTQAALDARIEYKEGAVSRVALDAAEAAIVAFRSEWRKINELRLSGYLHEFAALAAENKD